MADAFKVLGQIAPPATTHTALYSVPANKSASATTLAVCNRSATTTSQFRISVAVANEGAGTPVAKQYIYYAIDVPARDTFVATIGITLATTDVVYAYSSSTDLSFTLFGVEIS